MENNLVSIQKLPQINFYYTVNSFCEFINKLIENLQWNVVDMISFVTNTVFFVELQWFVLYWTGKSITNYKKYNEFNYNPAAIEFQCIFESLVFTV